MKPIIIVLAAVLLASCNTNSGNQDLQAQVDSLKSKLSNVYKPGFGEFMTSIQMHHAKLWFAGQNQNWKLADFEIHEIEEALENIQTYNTDRPEVKSMGMITAPMDSVKNAIQTKNLLTFTSSFNLLTNTCNNCHKATEHEFNIVTIPTTLPVVNQNFKVQ